MIQSRRDFLKNAGKIAVAASVASALPMSVVAEKAEHPFKYVHLDPDATADRAYAAFTQVGGCCASVAEAIIGQLAEVVGAPFDGVPIQMFTNGGAGYGQSSLCGCIGGAAACIGLVCDKATSSAILGELCAWYRETNLPIYDKQEKALAQVVPGSVNCADSLGDPGRVVRCSCLAADVSKKTVELLNAHYGV